jgi:DHA2 family multidrug resistance protein
VYAPIGANANDALAGWLYGSAARYAAEFGGDPAHGNAAALKRLWSLTWREAPTQTFADAFLVLAVCPAIATVLVPLMRNIAAPKVLAADAH